MVVTANFGSVGDVGRKNDIIGFVGRIEGVLFVFAMRVESGEPEEEGFFLGTVLEGGKPVLATAGGRGDHLAGFVILAGRENETGGGGFEDIIETINDVFAEMPLSGGGSIVTGGFEFFDEGDGFLGERPVELLRTGVVWVTPCNNAGSAGAAGIGGEISVFEKHAAFGESIEVWGLDRGMTVRAVVVPVHVVGDDEDEVGFFGDEGGDAEEGDGDEFGDHL